MVAVSSPRQSIHRSAYADYLRHLPLLEFTKSLYPFTDLKDVCLICAQHLVSTTYSLFHTLLSMGLKSNNISAIGKCYSTDPQAYEEMKKLGIDVCPASMHFDSHAAFDEQYRNDILQFVLKRKRKLQSGKFKKIIVLDDGGELISVLSNLVEIDDRFVGIEQTSSGFHRLCQNALPFPVINVARSPAKLNYESSIIAKLISETLSRNLKTLPLQPTNVLVIGHGAIGREVYNTLKEQYQISIVDLDPKKSSFEPRKLEKTLKEFDLIIGCTGKPVFGATSYKHLKKNAILVSASSSDREFSAASLRNNIPPITDCHANPLINGICLINCGFPINFSSDYRAIDCDELQLTRSLLLAAILQAAHHKSASNEFVSLDMENQREIISEFLSLFPKSKQHIGGSHGNSILQAIS